MPTVRAGLLAACAVVAAGLASPGARAQEAQEDQQAEQARQAQQAQAEQAVLDAYYDCAKAAARRLEPSGESADVIGRATRVLCQKESAGAVRVWLKISPNKAADNIERTLVWGDTVAAAEVISIRLCRQAKDCRSF